MINIVLSSTKSAVADKSKFLLSEWPPWAYSYRSQFSI